MNRREGRTIGSSFPPGGGGGNYGKSANIASHKKKTKRNLLSRMQIGDRRGNRGKFEEGSLVQREVGISGEVAGGRLSGIEDRGEAAAPLLGRKGSRGEKESVAPRNVKEANQKNSSTWWEKKNFKEKITILNHGKKTGDVMGGKGGIP